MTDPERSVVGGEPTLVGGQEPDAGHGGDDTGAVSAATRRQEKELVLDIARRTVDWGGPELWKKIGVQQEEFIISSDAWLNVKHGEGRDAIKSAYLEVLDGKSNPADGWWLSP